MCMKPFLKVLSIFPVSSHFWPKQALLYIFCSHQNIQYAEKNAVQVYIMLQKNQTNSQVHAVFVYALVTHITFEDLCVVGIQAWLL